MSFITNAPDKTLQGRLEALLQHAQELKFLVGYFYFSGYSALYDALRKAFEQNPDLRLKVLVGLSVDTSLGQLLEVARAQRKASNQEVIEALLSDLQKALSHPQLDDKTLPEQARFFLSLLRTGRLELRKTRSPTHAKLYLFKVKPDLLGLLPAGGSFLTGSSNLTQAGLGGQLEFNVEIKDYGFKEAEEFFDNLWQESVELLPKDVDRVQYIVERASLAASPTPLEVYALLLRRYLDTLDSRP
jgi:HKD family nuclease